MSRDPASLLDIINACRNVLEFTRGVSREQLGQSKEKLSAVMYQIAIIGEATRRLSPEFRAANAQVPWPGITSMRNRLIHEYDRIDVELIWDAVTLEVPELLKTLEQLTPPKSGEQHLC